MSAVEDLKQAIITGDRVMAKEQAEQAQTEGLATHAIVEAVAGAMEIVGEKFRANEFFVPELLIAQRAMKEVLGVMAGQEVDHIGTIVIGTVQGDLHDIGKNLVSAMLEGAGFRVVDLGVDVSPGQFITVAKETSADVVAMSALLTTTMGAMKETISALDGNGLRGGVKVMIGGAPVTQSYGDEIGADGYSPDAAAAVHLAKSLIGA